MKIIFVTPSLKSGGGNRVIIELSNVLCVDHEVQIIYPNNSNENTTFYLNRKIKLKSIGLFSKFKIMKLINVIKLIHFINSIPDFTFLVFTDPIFSIFAILLKKTNKIYRYIQADDYSIFDDGYLLGNGLLKKMYKVCCIIIYKTAKYHFLFNSRYTYDVFCRISRRNDIPYKLVHPSVNGDIFYPNDFKKECSICLVARVHPLKGLLTFLDAWKKLPIDQTSKIKNIYLISNDDLSGFNLMDFKIVKPKDDEEIADVYRKSMFFISTSWREGFGLPPIEAMFCGCACIVSDSGGVNEYAINNYNCLMYVPKEANELVGVMLKLLNNEILFKKIVENALKVRNDFSWHKSAKQLLDSL